MIRIGIDPGKKGFICMYFNNPDDIKQNYFEYHPIPLVKNEVDIHKLYDILSFDGENWDIKCVLEDVHAIFGASAKATFNFGWIVGAIEGILASCSIPYVKVQPKEWQKEMLVGIHKITKQGKKSTDTKAMSLLAAKRLFPNEDLRATERCTTEHDGKVDALLLAEYARRKF